MQTRTSVISHDDLAHLNRDLDRVVARLRASREIAHSVRHRGVIRELPSRSALADILEGLAAALFPTHYGHVDLTDESIDYFVGNTLNTTLRALVEQVRRGLLFAADRGSRTEHDQVHDAVRIVKQFADALPDIRALLVSDIQAAFHGDPAATSAAEILLCYPGLTAIMYHRFAHALHERGAALIARLIAEIAHSQTGIDIHPGARIEGSFFIDHGTGVVIGETCVIGKHVRLYQAVTLGAKRFPADRDGVLVKGHARHPIVEDEVVIYAGATVLGRITIGCGSSIGGNVWLTRSVPPGSNITQAQHSHETLDSGTALRENATLDK